jgi:hypothetical protein
MGRLLKFWSLTRPEKRFFFEATLLVLVAHICVRTIAFRHIYSFLRNHWTDSTEGGLGRADDIELVNASVSRAANLLPLKKLCLSQSIAAFIMLRRRGIPAALVAGVRVSEDSSLRAHAWVDISRGPTDKASDNSAFTAVVRIGDDSVIVPGVLSPSD